jgi:hypothetical protein
MSISHIGAQGNAGTTVTIPTHQSGDLILIFAYRDGNNTAPTTPSAGGTVPTWTLIGSSGGNNNSSNFRYAVATGSTTTSGTWTNASELICLVYRGTKFVGDSLGGGAQSATIAYPALSLDRTDGSSWVVGVAGHRTATNVDAAPSGMTNRAFTGTEAAGHDTDGGVTSWSQQTISAGANSGWRSWTVELRDESVQLLADTQAFTVTANAATLTVGGGLNNYSLAATTRSFAGTYNSAGLVASRKLVAVSSSFVLTRPEAGLRKTTRLVAETGIYSLTFSSVSLAYTPAADYSLVAASRAFNLNFRSANLVYSNGQTTVKRFYYQPVTDDPKSLDASGTAPGAGLVYYINKHFRVF